MASEAKFAPVIGNENDNDVRYLQLIADLPIVTQPTPSAVDATATVTAAQLMTRIITSTSAAITNATLPTGALMDGIYIDGLNMAYDWSVINTGPSAFNIVAGANHTVVGSLVVATLTSANFRSRRTAVGVWVTYRI